jgi:molybdopterin/thiamine biosynthesis adenylyltransferase
MAFSCRKAVESIDIFKRAGASPVIIQLAHLGVGRLVLVDPDRIEVKNLNRIPGATMKDALGRAFKVDVLKRYVEGLALGTEVLAINTDLGTAEAVRAIAECDIVFGCMDEPKDVTYSIESRRTTCSPTSTWAYASTQMVVAEWNRFVAQFIT